MNKSYSYRPLHISDYDTVTIPEQAVVQQMELDSWKKINFVAVKINSSKPYSMMFLTDLEGNILYRFQAMPPASTRGVIFSEISFPDINGDSLKDVKIMPSAKYWENPSEDDAIIYYQREDGLFYERELVE